jgi:hypothetical protein
MNFFDEFYRGLVATTALSTAAVMATTALGTAALITIASTLPNALIQSALQSNGSTSAST